MGVFIAIGIVAVAAGVIMWVQAEKSAKRAEESHQAWLATLTPEERAEWERQEYHQWYVENDPR